MGKSSDQLSGPSAETGLITWEKGCLGYLRLRGRNGDPN